MQTLNTSIIKRDESCQTTGQRIGVCIGGPLDKKIIGSIGIWCFAVSEGWYYLQKEGWKFDKEWGNVITTDVEQTDNLFKTNSLFEVIDVNP